MPEPTAAEIVNDAVSELGVGEDTPATEDAAPNNDSAQPEPVIDQETTEDTEQLDAEGNPIKPATLPAEGQDEVSEAVKSLSKVLGRELTDDEAVTELAKSHLGASSKIESLNTQIKDLVPFRQFHERLLSHPRIAEIQEILDGKTPDPVVDDLGDYDDVPPAITQKIAAMEKELAEFKRERQSESSVANQAKVAEGRKQVEAFAGKTGNEDFKKVLFDYWNDAKVNPYITAPKILMQFSALVDYGIPMERAWAALNPDKAAANLRTNIAKENERKPKLPITRTTRQAITPRPEDLDDPEEIFDAMLKEVRGRG